ncbi:MAG: 3-hydroxyacyl-CoA dehydrogenase family protein [Syntrophorhabdales bacterium]|jgi:3-hydroxybutyryl-CoA dehydrogenase
MEEVNSVGVVGAGMMGAEIALCFAIHGSTVSLKDVSLDLAKAGRDRVERILGKWVEKGRMASEERPSIVERILPVATYAGFENAQIVVEAVVEQAEVKGKIYEELDGICDQNCIFATNTSSIPISRLAAYTKRPERFVGMHFFSPASVMKLIEVIAGIQTGEEAVAKVMEMARSINKEPIRVADCAGFVVNRLLFAYFNEAWRMVNEGVATPVDIDRAVKFGLNHPVGIFESQDVVGLDLALAVTTVLQGEYGDRFMPAPVLKRKVEAGHIGRKAKKGWFDYRTKGE